MPEEIALERVILIKQTLIDPPEREEEQLPEMQDTIGPRLYLERHTSPAILRETSTRDSIDHAPGAHDDIASAVAGALVTAYKRPGNFNRPLKYPELGIV